MLRLHLEITTRCNAHCPMCPNDTLERRGRDMSMANALRYVDEAVGLGASELYPHTWGEPTLHPSYVSLVYAIKGLHPNLNLMGYTNGSKLADSRIRGAILANFTRITVSIDGATDGEMRATRPGLDPAKVEAGVRALFRDRTGGVPRIHIRYTARAEGPNRKAFIARWGPYCEHVGGVPIRGLPGGFGNVPGETLRTKGCGKPFRSVVVTVTDKAVLCCADYAAQEVLGDLRSGTLAQAWNGDRLFDIRRCHTNDDIANLPLCGCCTHQGA